MNYNYNVSKTLEQGSSYDLLRIKWIKRVILWIGFPYFFQVITLVLFISLILIGWKIYTPETVNPKFFASLNFVTLLIWGIWWPLMILVAVILGRVWCIICPLELVSSVAEKVSRKFSIRQFTLFKWIKSGGLIVCLYFIILMLIFGIHINRVPAYTSFFLLVLLTIAFISGIILKDRAFCRGFCPIGMLLNSYCRGSMIAVRASGSENSASCFFIEDCSNDSNVNTHNIKNCPSLLNPPKLNSNKDCLVCGQCIKSDDNEKMQLLIRKPFLNQDFKEERASWALTFYIMLESGFVLSELIEERKAANNIFVYIPDYITNLLSLHSISGFIEGFWTLIIVPIIIWIVLGFITLRIKKISAITDSWRQLALPLVIIISFAHLTEALAALNSKLNFLPEILKDPLGKNILQKISEGIVTPTPIFGNEIMTIFGVFVLSMAFIYSVREGKSQNQPVVLPILPKLFMYFLFLFIVIGLEFA